MYIIIMKKVLIVFCVLCFQLSVAAQPECFIPPVEGSDSVVILRVQHTAASLNEEYIVIFNRGNVTVDLSGWVIFNAYYEEYRLLPPGQREDTEAWKHIYKIPFGFKLNPKYWVRISSGHGQDNEMYLYRNLNEPWLDDAGDTLYLVDKYCNVIDEYSW